MIKSYRKYLEPEYGEVSPEVRIGTPQHMDLEHPGEWRIRTNQETIATVVAEIAKCSCYESLMRIPIREFQVRTEDGEIPVRIYHPDIKRPLPILLFLHGGAFSMNSIDVYDPVSRYLAAYGEMVVAAVEYRLAPEFPFPCGLQDCYRVLEWVESRAAELGGDPRQIVVCGDSSGGNFAAVLSMMARDRQGPKIWKQVLIYPLTALAEETMTMSERRYRKGYFLEYEDIVELWKRYIRTPEERYHPYVSPLYSEKLQNLPKAGFFFAECDPLLDQGLQYAAKLEDGGIEVEVHIYKGMIHAFLNAAYGKTFNMLDDICKFIHDFS